MCHGVYTWVDINTHLGLVLTRPVIIPAKAKL
jgi:hypothetical protein